MLFLETRGEPRGVDFLVEEFNLLDFELLYFSRNSDFCLEL